MLVCMSRWEPDARGRLERAAFELFQENGYATTTVPDIAARAGVTNRTFYRHFGDKQEVLFGPGNKLPNRVAELMREASTAGNLRDTLQTGIETAAQRFYGDDPDYFRARHNIIAAEPSLVERELGKQAILGQAICSGLIELGHDPLLAQAGAEVALAALRIAQARWIDGTDNKPLSAYVREAFQAIETAARGLT